MTPANSAGLNAIIEKCKEIDFNKDEQTPYLLDEVVAAITEMYTAVSIKYKGRTLYREESKKRLDEISKEAILDAVLFSEKVFDTLPDLNRKQYLMERLYEAQTDLTLKNICNNLREKFLMDTWVESSKKNLGRKK